ncbi:HNH endonuclease signature motif containing protein [Salinimonas sediminis]|uniref:Endonuclease I n=1 Tax=Salinimonas sediminis TaxID=2303538 RepID=A0A346NMB8_9ALTE|nr:endonuclease [Salinimonas sediminis]AXR06675.1 endonuclease I [Salinimonas sediminis]
MKPFTPMAVGVAAALLTSNAFANIQNAGFETWNGNQPSSWTTIDSGISVSQSTSIVYEQAASAKIIVDTGSQSSTDFRQTIDVQAGQQIDIATWVYHTEGSVAARLYVDGYHNYSDHTLTGQWQKLSYTYTPGTTGQIEVGLRFYDKAGFDGSEVVYIDNFTPAAGGGEEPGTCSSNAGNLTLTTDNYGAETSWSITDGSGSTVASGAGYASNSTTQESQCLANGDYTFTISDEYGDGICCNYGNGSYELSFGSATAASGGQFGSAESTNFTLGSGGGSQGGYYDSAQGKTGYALKTALHDIIKNHSSQSYSSIWNFYISYGLDTYDEKDSSIYDIYSENANGSDPYTYAGGSDQCGTYQSEGDCYNREHTFPKSWFGGAISPMNTDIHHVFASDGYVNGRRSSYPFGKVGSATYTSANGSKLGSAISGLGYSGTVFEPIDTFKGDMARAYFYMATRYENQIAGWENSNSSSDAALNGTSGQVFEPWFIAMLLQWHEQDPVSQFEIDRNEAAQGFQGNRNPFIDNPQWAGDIWGN